MKYCYLNTFVVFFELVVSFSVCQAKADYKLKVDIDWPSVLAKHDMVWDFAGGGSALPQKWTEEAFFGNGLLGGAVRVMDEEGKLSIRVYVGRSDIWDKRSGKSRLSQGNNFQFDRPRLPVGYFTIPLLGTQVVEGSMRVVLWSGRVEGEVRTERGRVTFMAFAHATKDQVLTVHLTRTGDEVMAASWEFVPEISAAPSWFMGFAKSGNLDIPKGWDKPKSGYRPNPRPKRSKKLVNHRTKTDGIEVTLSEQPLLEPGAGAYTTAWANQLLERAQVGDAEEKTLLVVSVGGVLPGGESASAAAEAVRSTLGANWEELKQLHEEYWHDFYSKQGALLSFPETWLEGFYYIQMYKLGCAMRAWGPVLDNVGPWLNTPTSWADIHWDLNLQLAYLPTLTSNHPELALSLVGFMNSSKTREALRKNVPKQYRAHGALAAPASGSSNDAVQSCYWSHSKDCLTEAGPHKGAIIGNLLWVCHVLYLRHRYHTPQDNAYLREHFYPLLHGAATYHLRLLGPNRRGGNLLHLPVTASPEYKENGADSSYDLALLRWGLQTLISIAKNHQVSVDAATGDPVGDQDDVPPLEPAPTVDSWEATLAKLAPYSVSPESGYDIAAGVPLKVGQRHFSHLLMIYPLQLEKWEVPGNRDLIARSVDHWVSLCQPKDGVKGGCAGYSYTGAAMFSLMMGRADAALGNLTELLGTTSTQTGAHGMGAALGPNTMYGERCKKLWPQPCPCMETPLHAADAIQGMFLQSNGRIVDVFPAIPSNWGEVVFHQLRAEGAFLISGKWYFGESIFVRVKSLAGEDLVLRPRVRSPVAAIPESVELIPDEGNEGVFHVRGLEVGEEVLIYHLGAQEQLDKYVISPVAQKRSHENFCGKH